MDDVPEGLTPFDNIDFSSDEPVDGDFDVVTEDPADKDFDVITEGDDRADVVVAQADPTSFDDVSTAMKYAQKGVNLAISAVGIIEDIVRSSGSATAVEALGQIKKGLQVGDGLVALTRQLAEGIDPYKDVPVDVPTGGKKAKTEDRKQAKSDDDVMATLRRLAREQD